MLRKENTMAFPKWFKRKAKNGKDHNESTVKEILKESEGVSPEKAETKKPPSQPVEHGAGFFDRLKDGLAKTRDSFVAKIDTLLSSHKAIDEELFERLEELLIQADVGVDTTLRLVDDVKDEVRTKGITDSSLVRPILQTKIHEILTTHSSVFELPKTSPAVILVVGVNGAGKTTTIGKLAHRFKSEGHKVILGAGDTFRAAAIEQLEIWAERVGVDIVKHQPGADPAAVAYDAIQAGRARQCDVVIIDTAGRLQTKTNLMRELEKIGRVVEREVGEEGAEVLLVVDATTGQNALSQAKLFSEAVDVSGLVLAKLDGTAKGGIVIAIAAELELPVKFIGIGEAYEDLRDFDADEFAAALFDA